MRNKRRLLATLLFRTGALHALKRLLPNRIVVLNYHRIRPDVADFTTPFDDDVFGPTAAQFESQMKWLKQHLRVLSEAELLEGVRTGRGPGEMSVLITTDDGYVDNYTRAYPILRKYGLPAIYFVASDMIESRRLGWWDLLAYTLKKTQRSQITYDGQTWDLAGHRDDAFSALSLKIIEAMPNERSVLEHLARLCEVDPPNETDQDAELMTWEHLREVSGHGIAVGSHAHSHRVLSRLSPDQQQRELVQSKELISRRVGREVCSVAYPTGGRVDFTGETESLAKESGYELGFSFHSGYNQWPTMNAFDVKRTEVAQHDRIGIAGVAILPELLSWPF